MLTLRGSALARQRMRVLLMGLLVLGTCDASDRSQGQSARPLTQSVAPSVQKEELRMWITVGQQKFAVTVADTEAARAFVSRLPLTLNMSELNGNEKHATVPSPLPANASRPGTIRSGDLMLYGTDTVVIFYVTFESAYSYTRLGRIDDPAGLAEALGKGSATVSFSVG